MRASGEELRNILLDSSNPERICEQDPGAVRRRLRRDYPAIVARAKAEGIV